jgi:LCP family protein required for cell wall assembly
MSGSSSMTPQHRRAVLIVICGTLVILALTTGTVVAVFYRHLDANLRTGQRIDHVVEKEHSGPTAQLNLLVLGIDSRAGAGNAIDGEAGLGGSDTNILLHLSADRRTAYGVSIARDTLVTRPDCVTESGRAVPGGTLQMWNEAYALAGPACTAKQVEAVTGIPVDGYLAVDFEGFRAMVDVLDGVEVCIPKDVDDQRHGITLRAGTQTLRGRLALDYFRERFSTPNSDLGRMKRQQAFITSMIGKLSAADTLARPDKLMRFAGAVTSSVIASPGYDTMHDLVRLAGQLGHIDLSHVRFVTAPVMAYPQDVNRFVLAPGARRLWQRIASDKPLSRALAADAITAGSAAGSGGPTSTSSPPSSASTRTPDIQRAAQQAAANGLCA